MNSKKNIIISIIGSILFILYFINDGGKLYYIEKYAIVNLILIVVIVVLILIMRNKIKPNMMSSELGNLKNLKNETNLLIPENCPHCKNPNTKRIRLCEWCGSQIC